MMLRSNAGTTTRGYRAGAIRLHLPFANLRRERTRQAPELNHSVFSNVAPLGNRANEGFMK